MSSVDLNKSNLLSDFNVSFSCVYNNLKEKKELTSIESKAFEALNQFKNELVNLNNKWRGGSRWTYWDEYQCMRDNFEKLASIFSTIMPSLNVDAEHEAKVIPQFQVVHQFVMEKLENHKSDHNQFRDKHDEHLDYKKPSKKHYLTQQDVDYTIQGIRETQKALDSLNKSMLERETAVGNLLEGIVKSF